MLGVQYKKTQWTRVMQQHYAMWSIFPIMEWIYSWRTVESYMPCQMVQNIYE